MDPAACEACRCVCEAAGDGRAFWSVAATLAPILGVLIGLLTFLQTQRLARKAKRAETLRDLVAWFRGEREKSAELKAIADTLVYRPQGWTFDVATDLESDGERALAKILNVLNYAAFHVGIELVEAQDLCRTELGYYYGVLVDHPGVEAYLAHVAAFDAGLGRRPDSGFYYFRHYGHLIAGKRRRAAL